MKALVTLLLSGCSFAVPGKDDAREQCLAYAEAVRLRDVECGDAPGTLERGAAENRDYCATVTALNPLGSSVEQCIQDYRALACEVRGSTAWCNSFL